jgi:hypothetical protein
MAVLKLTAGLGLTAGGIGVFENSDWNEQRVAATAHGMVRALAACKETQGRVSVLMDGQGSWKAIRFLQCTLVNWSQ